MKVIKFILLLKEQIFITVQKHQKIAEATNPSGQEGRNGCLRDFPSCRLPELEGSIAEKRRAKMSDIKASWEKAENGREAWEEMVLAGSWLLTGTARVERPNGSARPEARPARAGTRKGRCRVHSAVVSAAALTKTRRGGEPQQLLDRDWHVRGGAQPSRRGNREGLLGFQEAAKQPAFGKEAS